MFNDDDARIRQPCNWGREGLKLSIATCGWHAHTYVLLRLSSRYGFRRLASQLAPLPGQGLRLPRGVGALAWEGGLIKS